VPADIHRTTLGTAAAADVARAHREAVWAVVAPMVARQMTEDAIAAELNGRAVPRLRGGAGWTRAAVSQLRAACQ
jgi:hypothetical protein